MTAIADPKPQRPSAPEDAAPGRKGLKSNAISYASNVVIATASTAPAYSLAAALGFIIAVKGVGLSAPALRSPRSAPTRWSTSRCPTTWSWSRARVGL